MKTNKLFTGAVSIVCAGAMLVAGAFAWQGGNSVLNQFFGTKTEVPPPEDPPVVVENFDAAMGVKEVSVRNTGSVPVYARLNLSEYMVKGDTAPKEGDAITHAWVLHTPTDSTLIAGSHGTNYEPDFSWIFDKAVHVGTYLSNPALYPSGTWVYDNDGWAYWSEPIQPNEKTDDFLSKVITKSHMDDTDYYYAINVGFEFCDFSDLDQWLDGAAPESGNPSDQMTQINSVGLQNHFKGKFATAAATVNEYEFDVTGLLSSYQVDDVPVVTSIRYRLNGSSDAFTTLTAAEIAKCTITPAAIAADTKTVSVKIPVAFDGDGKVTDFIVYRQSISVGAAVGITLADGSKFAQVDPTGAGVNSRIYEKLDASGTGTGTYVYYQGVNAADFTDGATIPASAMLDVIYHDTPAINVPASGPDPAYTVTTNYLIDWDGGWSFIPVYPQGVNYWQAFVAGTDPALGNGDERATGIAISDQVPLAQRSNW